jgi:hypothetical protein
MEEYFEKLFKSYHQQHATKTLIVGIAKNVGDKTCTVTRDGQPDLIDVRLNAIDADIQTKILVKPKEGSYVLVGIISNIETDAVVLATSEIDSVQIITGELLFEMKDGKFKVNKGVDGLGKCIKDLITQIQAIYAPKNTAAIAAIQTRLNAFLDA